MIITILRYTFSLLTILLVQVTVLNNFQILGWATAYFYIYYIITLPVNTPKSLIYTLGFGAGLILDIFCNTPGMHTLSTLFTAVLRNPALNLYYSREESESSSPTAVSLGMWRFMSYAVTLVLTHHILLFLIESFALFNPTLLFGKIAACTLFTSMLIFAFENIKNAHR